MKVDRIKDVRPTPTDEVTLKTAGNVMEIRYARNTAGSPIQKLDKGHGLDTRTGEVIDYQHNQNRAGDMASVAQSLKRLRDIINANLENPDRALWVTLTYAENMTDTKRLYKDLSLGQGYFLNPQPRMRLFGWPRAKITNRDWPCIDIRGAVFLWVSVPQQILLHLVAAKLELGPFQTLAHQDADGEWELIDPPDYDLQYLLCSQYSPITGEWVGSQHSNQNLLHNWYLLIR